MALTKFASVITELRKKKRISQKNASKELGISQALLSHYENGVRECGLEFVIKAAKYYGVSCDYLLGNEDNSVNFDMTNKPSETQGDGELSINTLYKANLFIGSRLSPEIICQAETYYAIASYILLQKGMQSGCIPDNWTGGISLDKLQQDFLFTILKNTVEEIEKNIKPTKSQEAPLCVRTLSNWANEYLNGVLADLTV
jgi:transcriptional regulator with XRE-family HTH domain